MTEHYSENAKEFISQQAPWRQGVAWWVVLIQGLLLLALGLYILFRQGAAGIQVVQFLGIFLLLLSILGTIRGLRHRVASKALPYHMLAAGIGLTTGTIISLNIWQEFMTATASLVIVSIGFMLYGLVGLLEWVLGGKQQRTWLAFAFALLSLVLGLAVLWSRLALAGSALWITGSAATVAGLGLAGYAALLYQRGKESTADQGVLARAVPAEIASTQEENAPPAQPLPPTSFVADPPPAQDASEQQ